MEFRWQWRAHVDALACSGLREGKASGVQKISLERRKRFSSGTLTAGGAIERIAYDGTSKHRKMDANLVRSAGAQIGLDQRETVETQTSAPIGARLPAGAAASRHSCATPQIARNRQID
ncbi:MAG TPA: hypothetical protein VLW83_12220, partial [Candidatus Acidoferrales bacterium]|nr:hypothetical protein [Candidatus Acidoferrales bacterium]